jgi:hypothetical protein
MYRVRSDPVDKTVKELDDLDPFEDMVTPLSLCYIFRVAAIFSDSVFLMSPTTLSAGEDVLLYCHC